MRIFKLISALIVVLAFAAVAVATASATEVLWVFLPGAEKTAFTGKSAKATLQVKGGAAITCPLSTTTGELTAPKTDATLALALIKFGKNEAGQKCNVAGIAANSKGDESGVILVHLEIHTCLISAGHRGLKIEILPVIIEVSGLTIEVKGAIVAEGAPFEESTKTYKLVIAQKAGVQGIEKCEGGVKQTLLSSLNKGAFVESGEEAEKGEVNFTTVAQEAMA